MISLPKGISPFTLEGLIPKLNKWVRGSYYIGPHLSICALRDQSWYSKNNSHVANNGSRDHSLTEIGGLRVTLQYPQCALGPYMTKIWMSPICRMSSKSQCSHNLNVSNIPNVLMNIPNVLKVLTWSNSEYPQCTQSPNVVTIWMSPISPKSQYTQNLNVPNMPNVLMNVPNVLKVPK